MDRIDPRKQFSKRLAGSGAIYWYFYMTLLAGIICVQPAAATAIIVLAALASVVMIFHVWAYTRNSIYEKGILALLDKVKMEMQIKSNDLVSAVNVLTSIKNTDEQDEKTKETETQG